MPDESVSIAIENAFGRIGDLRAAISEVQSPPAIATPDVFVATATESLRAISELIGCLPDFARWEATLLANAESLGAMDAYMADNPCINWHGPADE